MKNLLTTMTLAALVLATTASCKTDQPVAEAAGPPGAAPKTGAASSDDVARRLEALLGVYEQARSDLAADRIDGAVKVAARIESSAREASGKAPASLRPHLERLARAAADLKGAPADKADEVRRRFGEVSRPIVALLAAAPSLARGRHVFECPMAQGYKKWVQPAEEISNPYMGTRMLRCGSKSRWSP